MNKFLHQLFIKVKRKYLVKKYYKPEYDFQPNWHTNRTEIINWFIKHFRFKKYLEIGVAAGNNFKLIEILSKVGVDPDLNSYASIHMVSDEYFKLAINKGEKFDIIFIDGLHESKQVYRDIINSLKCLNKGGMILLHDINPWNELVQTNLKISKIWCGDCWKAFVRLRSERDDLEMMVVDTDCGIGVIREGKQNKIKIKGRLDWKNLNAKRVEWLNLVSFEEFKKSIF